VRKTSDPPSLSPVERGKGRDIEGDGDEETLREREMKRQGEIWR
jgi:hypothetical protein